MGSNKFLYCNIFSDTAQTSEATDDGGLVDHEKNSEETESLKNPENPPLPEGLEDLQEESVKTGNIVLLTGPEQELVDVVEIKEVVELNSEEGFSVIITTPCEEDCRNPPQSETKGPVVEVDSKQSEEPDLIQESDPPQPGESPDLVCDAVETGGTEDSENEELTIIVNDEKLELENAKTVVQMQESVSEVKQEEPICGEQNESIVKVELHGHKEQLIQQSECSDELENSEESKQELLIGEEPSEESKQSSFNEAETLDQASESKSTDDVEKNSNETELLDQSEMSVGTETSELAETKDSKETSQPDELQQTEQESHTNSEQHQNHAKESEEVSPEHVHEEVEQKEESVEHAVPYKNGNIEVVDREEACKLAERLYRLDNIQRTDVVRHLDKE